MRSTATRVSWFKAWRQRRVGAEVSLMRSSCQTGPPVLCLDRVSWWALETGGFFHGCAYSSFPITLFVSRGSEVHYHHNATQTA